MPSSACVADHRDPHSFPTRRSSDLQVHRHLGADLGWDQVKAGGAIDHVLDQLPANAQSHGPALLAAEALHPLADIVGQGDAGHLVVRSEEHTSELQSLTNLVCRLLLASPTTEIHTLSLHDALPISRSTAISVRIWDGIK